MRDHPIQSALPIRYIQGIRHHITVDYREAYGLHASNGILFNHESPRRGGTFVTTQSHPRHRGNPEREAGAPLPGNLDAKRDWGYAQEYVEAMWLMLQQPTPDDYVIATGEMHSVASCARSPSASQGWIGSATSALIPSTFRPTEVDTLWRRLEGASQARLGAAVRSLSSSRSCSNPIFAQLACWAEMRLWDRDHIPPRGNRHRGLRDEDIARVNQVLLAGGCRRGQ